MTLIEQLRAVLSSHLPEDPAQALSGMELVARLRSNIEGKYADGSIRQNLSILAADPTSPIARLEGGHGYYRRPLLQPGTEEVQVSPASGGNQRSSADTEATGTGRDNQAEEKFRALYLRLARWEARLPMRIEHLSGQRQPQGVNKWKFPDVIVVDWLIGESSENGFALDRSLLEVKRGLGERPFNLTSVELKVELSLGTFREHFFQCVSNSMWAHQACLAIAMPVSDSLLAAELRRLGGSHGVMVQTFGLSSDMISALPPAKEILSIGDDAFEKLAQNITPQTLAAGKMRPSLDWEHLRDMKAQSPEFKRLFDWVARCLRDGNAYALESFLKLISIENGP